MKHALVAAVVLAMALGVGFATWNAVGAGRAESRADSAALPPVTQPQEQTIVDVSSARAASRVAVPVVVRRAGKRGDEIEVVVLDALPRNIAGKTLKRELRERYLAARAG